MKDETVMQPALLTTVLSVVDSNSLRPFSAVQFRLKYLLGLIVIAGITANAQAQETSSDWAWKEITRIDGVEFFYIYYSEVREESNGVVMKLVNWNDYAVEYRFTVVFKTGSDQVETPVSGRIDPQTLVTGDEAGLFFLPFDDGRSVGEIGIKKYRIKRLDGSYGPRD